MKKLLLALLLLLGTTAYAATPPFTSTQLSPSPSNGQVLQTDGFANHWVATSSLGFGSGAVTSVFGRTGAVIAQTGDYTTAQITEVTNLFFTNARAIGATLTGFVSGAGTVSPSDTILSAIDKLDGNIAAKLSNITGLVTAGTNVTITGAGTSGSPYVVNSSGGGGGSNTDFTTTTNYGTTVNSTSTPLWFTAGFMASTTNNFLAGLTVDSGTTNTGLIVNGHSTTVGSSLTISDITTSGNQYTALVNPSGASGANANTIPLTATFSTGGGTTGGLIFDSKPAAAPIVFYAGGNSLTTNERLRITGAGLIGIASSTPTSLLSVGGNVFIGAATAGGTNGTVTIANLGSGFVQASAAGLLSSAALTSGQVTTALGFTPFGGTNPLPVANGGTASTTGIANGITYYDPTNTFLTASTSFVRLASGNVGIGIANPASKLDVVGDINFASNAAIRQGGGQFAYGSSTTNSLFVGDGAGGVNGLSSSTLVDNVGIGRNALKSIAATAGQVPTDNVGVGYQAMFNTTSGFRNVGLGTNALYSNTIGRDNMAIGYQSLFLNTTGVQNVAIGFVALQANVGGSSNIAIGYHALLNNVSGNSNLAFGVQAGEGTTGSNNVQIGDSETAASASSVTTGSNNFQLGYRVALPDPTANNQLDIGNILFGTSLDGTDHALSTGNLGVGTSSPWGRFSVNAKAGGSVPSFVVATSTTGFATSTAFEIDQNGLIGVSTTTPGSILSIGNTGGINFTLATSSFATVGGINITNGCYAVGGVCLSTGGTNFFTNSGANTWLTTGSNLGVGSTSPWATLSVSTTTQSSGLNALFSVASSTNATLFTVLGNGNVGIGTTNPVSPLQVRGGSLTLDDSAGIQPIDANSGLVFTSAATITGQGDESAGVTSLTFSTRKLTTGLAYDFQTRTSGGGTLDNALTIQNQTSNVGVGTSSPFAQLSVNGIANGSRALFDVASSTSAFATTSVFYIDNNGLTGISTTTPGSLLSIGKTGGINFTLATSSFATVGGINITNGCYAVGGVCLSTGGSNFFTNLGANTWLTTGSNLGVGSTTPTATLAVGTTTASTAFFPMFTVASSTNAAIFTVINTGGVGIGSSTPYASGLAIDAQASGDINLFPLVVRSFAPSTARFIFQLNEWGDAIFGGDKPTLSSCGNPISINGNTAGGTVVLNGGTAASSCTITWAHTIVGATGIACIVQNHSATNVMVVGGESLTTLVVTSAANFAGSTFDYKCTPYTN